MSRPKQRTGRRPVTRRQRSRFLADLAAATGQPLEEVAEHIRQAVDMGWLIETPDGWQAAIPTDLAPADWTGPVT